MLIDSVYEFQLLLNAVIINKQKGLIVTDRKYLSILVRSHILLL
jgi:hypothetical protein